MAHILNKFKDNTVIRVVVEGNNSSLVIERARDKAKLVLKAVKAYLNDHMSIHDPNLLFDLSAFALIKKVEVQGWHWSWKRKREPFKLTIGDHDKKYLDRAENNYQISRNFDSKLRARYERAAYWMGMSIEEEEFDKKIISLCIALESLLVSKNDKRKGEVIAYRMLIVNHLVEGSFPEPFGVMAFYELRSEVVHGSSLFEATYSDYSKLHYTTRKTLFNFIIIAEKNGVKKYDDFLKVVESTENIELMKSYFGKFKGEWPKAIISELHERLSK